MTNIVTQFELVRENETFAIILPQLPQERVTRTRFRHHGPRKFRTELEVAPQVKRITISRERACKIAKKAHRDGRITSYPIDATAGEWSAVIRAVR